MRCFLFLLLIIPVFSFSQQKDVVDFLKIDAEVSPVKQEGKIFGQVRCTFKILQKTDSVYLDAVNMKILKSALEGVRVSASEKKIWFTNSFEAGREYTAFFHYEATPVQTLYFTGDQMWTQGQGKYTSHWLPSIDDMNDKIEFDLTIVSVPDKTVISNGKLISSFTELNEKYSRFDMQHPMSSYLVAFAIGDFQYKELTTSSSIPVQLFYKPEDSAKAEPTYRYTKEIFDFLEAEIGVAYPWQNYKQVPVRDFLYAGMENTTATIFSEAFVVDSIGFNDRNYVNVNAHELAHQWFGDLVTETEGTHHWLHEGFATYYALLAEKEIFGDDYYYWKLLQSAERLDALSREGKGESLLDPKASSLTFYEKGAWALHVLKELIGEENFRAAVRSYLEKYSFKNVTTANFLAEVKLASSVDLSQWEADWLQQTAFKAEQALELLIKNKFIKDYFATASLREIPFRDKKDELHKLLEFPNDYLGQEAVYQLAYETLEQSLPLYKTAFGSKNLLVRQAIAESTQAIPLELKTEFESLLQDDSYVTIEYALRLLCISFPEDRLEYLEKTKYLVGFQNKNVKLLWLAIAIYSEAYGVSDNDIFLSELRNYTGSAYSFEVREQALIYVFELNLINESVLKNLVNACVHHNWRFRNQARELLETVLEDPDYKSSLLELMGQLADKEKNYLASKIEKQ